MSIKQAIFSVARVVLPDQSDGSFFEEWLERTRAIRWGIFVSAVAVLFAPADYLSAPLGVPIFGHELRFMDTVGAVSIALLVALALVTLTCWLDTRNKSPR